MRKEKWLPENQEMKSCRRTSAKEKEMKLWVGAHIYREKEGVKLIWPKSTGRLKSCKKLRMRDSTIFDWQKLAVDEIIMWCPNVILNLEIEETFQIIEERMVVQRSTCHKSHGRSLEVSRIRPRFEAAARASTWGVIIVATYQLPSHVANRLTWQA